MKNIPLHWKIIIGLILGVIWAILSSFLGWSKFTIDWINPFGVIFINLLKLIAIPLVLFSIIKGIADLKDINSLGKIGIKTLGAYLVTTVIAISVGLGIVNISKPGEYVDQEQRVLNRLSYELWVQETNGVEIKDGKNYLNDPQYSHLKEVAIANYHGSDIEDIGVLAKVKSAKDRKEDGPLQILVDVVPSNIFFALGSNSLMLQIIFFGLFFGAVMLMIDEDKAKPVFDFVVGSNEIFLKMVDVVMKAAPFFVFALLAGKISEMAGDDPGKVLEIFLGLGTYSLAVIIGLGLLILVIYPLIVHFFVKGISYKDFFKGIGEAQALAFSTSSSAATLPVTMECVNEKLGVSKKITSFVLPIGATVNMDGTSLYISVAVVFLAQFHLIDLSFAQQLTIVLTATLASIGASAVPSAGLIMMIMVLQSVGLNPAWIAIIFPVDRILDMLRTVVNVTGDATVSAVIASAEGELGEKNL
jgi:Na+/H+-dicarboxylate symporter